ncbi:MAG: hypothetical protein B7Z53_02155 [Rhodospirillales bacterium 12-71-4]|nr:MAG: hypothetical protein B7Z53_02155 [Rhodospirillales bacterium 12-71-4]
MERPRAVHHHGRRRGLYVDSVSLNGADLHRSGTLKSNGTAEFGFGQETPTAAVQLGRGPDVLAFEVSQDAWNGNAEFQLYLDGVAIGGRQAAHVSHATGHGERYEILGDFDAGDHVLGIRFLNDAWGGSAAKDRNLYVDELSLNGDAVAGHAALMSNGDVFLQF